MQKEYKYTNRLINEKSPYLLQHAHNPVDWFPWGQDAFDRALKENKPIFLSIGYATCHWCHVMEKESFENKELADLMNETFINIKVDREELPEIDSLYMEFAQSMMAGAAGWPLNVILTPKLKPFFATTYLPPYKKQGLIGLNDLISRITEVWYTDEQERILMQADKIVEVFAENIHTKGDREPSFSLIETTTELIFKMADSLYGGLKGAPKFPLGYQINFLLRYTKLTGDTRALFLAEKTLDMMQRGGIYDHLGGGFHRYSIDEKWIVPHFEKMLYDNALLLNSYLEAWHKTKNDSFKNVCIETINYLIRDLKMPQGAFYSAQDADSEGGEGLFYTWTYDELVSLIGENESELFREFYGITKEGNFEGRCVLNTPLSLDEFANQKKINKSEILETLSKQKNILSNYREKRTRPFTDDKILSSWNGLIIHSLCEAGLVLSDRRYIDAALNAAQFIRYNMWDQNTLSRRWREGESQYNGGLDEYAFLIRGLLSLFEADLGSEWLAWAIQLSQILQTHFKADGGAFYYTDGSDPNIILRKSQFSDGAEPSGNAVHCENLLRLYQITFDPIYLEQAEDVLKAAKHFLDTYSPGYMFHMMNLIRYYDKDLPTIVVALNRENTHYETLKNFIYESYIPHKAVVWKYEDDEKLPILIPSIAKQIPIEGKTTLYICRNRACKEPLTTLNDMISGIRQLS